jgi:hypothetical protein
MIGGGIFERESITPKSFVCSSKPVSIVHFASTANTKINTPMTVIFAPHQVPQQLKSVNFEVKKSLMEPNDHELESNDFLIEKMNLEERSSAMEEINSLISVRNIQFLCKTKQNINENQIVYKKSISTTKITENKQLTDVRYDLDGRRVLLKSNVTSIFLDVFNNVDIFKQATSTNISSMSSQFISQFLAVGLFSVHDDTKPSTEPQNELFNHEQSPESPGYTLNEVCEVRAYSCLFSLTINLHSMKLCRSDFPNQRIISFRILTGVLTRRDFVTSLNVYRHDLAHSSLLPLEFIQYSEELNKLITTIVSWQGCVGCDKIVGDILVDVMFRLCVSDSLPPSIPSLLRWGMQIRNSSPSLRLSTVQCLQAFLSSAVEVSCAETLWLGFWGTYGVPSLLTPHAKRSGVVTYEEHFVNCREKAKSLSSTDVAREGDEDEVSAQDLNDSFVMACRWCRVDTLVAESDIVRFLVDAALDGVTCVLQCSSGLPNSSVVAIGLVAVSNLHALVVGASGDATLHSLHKQLLVSSRRSVLTVIAALVELMSETRFNSDESPNIAALLEEWVRLLVEISRRCTMSAEVLFRSEWNGITCTMIKTICRRKGLFSSRKGHGEKIIAWVLRLWRVGLVHGVGLRLLTEFLESIFLQTSSCDTFLELIKNKNGKVVFNISGLSLNHSQFLLTELFWLLEQGAVTASHVVRTIESSEDVERCGLVLLWTSQIVVRDLEDILSDKNEFSVLLRSAQLHFLASVIGVSFADRTHLGGDSLARSVLLHTLVRGSGLLPQLQCGVCSPELTSLCASLVDAFSSTHLVLKTTVMDAIRDLNSRRKRWVDSEKLVALSRVLVMLQTLNFTSNSTLSMVASLQSSVCESSVSSGIFSWQNSRLDQVVLLVRLQLLALSDCSFLLVEVLHSLEQFTDSMSGCVVFLLNQIIGTILGFGTDHEQHRKSLLSAVLAVTLTVSKSSSAELLSVVPQDIQFGSCVYLGSRSPERCAITNWIFDCFTGKIPLHRDWQYKCLKILEYDDLCAWLNALHTLETFTSANGRKTDVMTPLSNKIFMLLQIVCKESSVKWYKNSSEINQIDSELVNAFCSLMHLLLESEVSVNFGESLKLIAQSNYFTVASAFVHHPGRHASSSGLLELCDDLLDSAFSCHLDEDIHAVALRVLIIPSVDWVVRERIWKKLGELRLLHLMEGSSWVIEKSVFFSSYPVVSARSESNVCLAIIDSLISLRGVDDRKWSIVQVGLFQVARFIFCSNGTSIDQTLSACSTRLLFHAVNEELLLSDQFSPWLVVALLVTASNFIFASDSSATQVDTHEDAFYKNSIFMTLTDDQHQNLSGSMLGILNLNNELRLAIENLLIRIKSV